MRPLPKFNLNQAVKVSREVYEGKEQPYIVGYEWGDDNRRVRAKSNTYLYYVKLEPGLEWVLVSKEELVSWGN